MAVGASGAGGDGATPLPEELTAEWDGRSFAVIDLAVRQDFRHDVYEHASDRCADGGTRDPTARIVAFGGVPSGSCACDDRIDVDCF